MSATLHPAASSPSSSILPLPPGVQKDSIEDLNSTKDMTGIITTHSGDDNPYLKLLPEVCQYIPQTVADQLGTPEKTPQFDGKLLAGCHLASPFRNEYSKKISTITLDAISLEKTRIDKTKQFVGNPFLISPKIIGYTYHTESDKSRNTESCSTVWGTFYGTATMLTTLYNSYPGDTCEISKEAAKSIAPILPKTPAQMRR